MMKKYILPVLTMLFVLSACNSTTPNPDSPVSSDDAAQPQPANDYLPNPADTALTREVAFVEGSDLLTMESFPLQFMLILKGNLPTPCNQLRVAVSPPNGNNEILVDVYSLTDPETLCAEVIQPFEVNVSLGSFPAGHYKLIINENPGPEFDA